MVEVVLKGQRGRILYRCDVEVVPADATNDWDRSRASDVSLALGKAVSEKVDLSGLVLKNGRILKCDLSGAKLRGSDFSETDFVDCRLDKADFREANLTNANFWSCCDLITAKLKGARIYQKGQLDLSEEMSRSIKWSQFDWSETKEDLFKILRKAKAEVAALKQAIVDGKVDGSTYGAAGCVCLVGTLAKARGVQYYQLKGISPQADRPAEQFFNNISEGDTPKTNPFSAMALKWVNEFIRTEMKR